MAPDAMTVRLHLRRIRVIAVVADLIEKLVVEVCDVGRVFRCLIVGSGRTGCMTGPGTGAGSSDPGPADHVGVNASPFLM